jgi:molecular chaperone DnaK (HSP70)
VRFGIDFGTTRTLVATADRGNFPVVTFTGDRGETSEHIPSIAADVDGQLVFGLEAVGPLREGYAGLRSFKRLLSHSIVSPHQLVRVGSLEMSLSDLLVGFLEHVRAQIFHHSNAPIDPAEGEVEAVVAVPANALSAQRFMTLEAFRRAGFTVRTILNEPSAAGFEFTHRQARAINAKRSRVLVYDLGGGTFDASLVRVDDGHHQVLGTAGEPLLGGDDFDEVLLDLALEAAGLERSTVSLGQRLALLEQCRELKERIVPQSKRIAVDLSALEGAPSEPVSVPVETFNAAVTPLVERSIEVMTSLVPSLDDDGLADVAGIYLVGGGTGLPLVARLLRERFGRRVHRSPYPAASTAIGLAIAADDAAAFSLTDRFGRGFGVFREREAGQTIGFDTIIEPDCLLHDTSPTEIRRRYRSAHNVGHFRFVECRSFSRDGEPSGDLTPFGEVLFPFDPSLRVEGDLSAAVIEQSDHGTEVEELYRINPSGLVEVTIRDLDTGYERAFQLGAS